MNSNWGSVSDRPKALKCVKKVPELRGIQAAAEAFDTWSRAPRRRGWRPSRRSSSARERESGFEEFPPKEKEVF